MKKEESFRSVYTRTWEAVNFLSENDHMNVFDQKIVWISGFIVVTSGVLFLGMALWNIIEPKHQIDGIYVLFTVAGIALITLIAYLIFLSLHNHEVVEKKTTLAEVQAFYPEVWEIVQGYTDYSLIPEEIDRLDKDYSEDEELEEEEDVVADNPLFALPEQASGIDYEDLINDEETAQYLEDDTPTVEEMLAEIEKMRRG